jgi:hypothetical protein
LTVCRTDQEILHIVTIDIGRGGHLNTREACYAVEFVGDCVVDIGLMADESAQLIDLGAKYNLLAAIAIQIIRHDIVDTLPHAQSGRMPLFGSCLTIKHIYARGRVGKLCPLPGNDLGLPIAVDIGNRHGAIACPVASCGLPFQLVCCTVVHINHASATI